MSEILQAVMGTLPIAPVDKGQGCHQAEIAQLAEPIVIDLRFNSAQNCPFQAFDESSQRWLEERLRYLPYFDCPSDEALAQQHCYRPVRLLTPAEIARMREQCPQQPNVVIFIHGFNVPFGDFGKVFVTPEMKPTAGQVWYQDLPTEQLFALKAGVAPALLWREAQTIKQQLGVPHVACSAQEYNGWGCHRWWLNMEYNLNVAAGFSGFARHYSPEQPGYTRIVNVAWLGKPRSPLDYTAVLPIAELTAYGLAELLAQCCDEKLQVSVIAHSAGNIVLLKAMQLLAQHAQYFNAIYSTCHWQAAVPHYAISPQAAKLDKSLDRFWQTADAHKVTQRMLVCSSLHDNVLGPIDWQGAGYEFAKKYHSSHGNIGKSLLPLGLSVADHWQLPHPLVSLYHSALLFSVPATALLTSPFLRGQCYARLRKYSQLSQCPETLLQQYQLFCSKGLLNNTTLELTLSAALLGFLAIAVMVMSVETSRNILISLDEIWGTDLAPLLQRYTQYLTQGQVEQSLQNLDALLSEHKLEPLKRYKDTLASNSNSNTEASSPVWQMAYDIVQGLLAGEACQHFIAHQTLNHALRELHCEKQVPRSLRQTIQEIIALLLTVELADAVEPAPALGYSGPDWQDPALQALREQGKLIHCDQTAYLFSHSGMLDPDPATRDRLFRDDIYQQAIQRLGGWSC